MAEQKFGGATTESAMQGQAAVPPAQRLHNAAGPPPSEQAPPAVEVPKHSGNQHMLVGQLRTQPVAPIGVDVSDAQSQRSADWHLKEEGKAHLPQTSGTPSAAAGGVKVVGDTVIVEESEHGDGGQKLSEMLPKPRTDPDAEPSEMTFPGFQGFDKINPSPTSVPLDRAIEHRGPVGEPRVTGVVTTGDQPMRVIGSESPEAKAIESGESDGKLETEQERFARSIRVPGQEPTPPQVVSGAPLDPNATLSKPAFPEGQTGAQPVPPDTYPLTAGQAQTDLRTDGPTPKEWEDRGYPKDAYPPDGFAKKDNDGNIVS